MEYPVSTEVGLNRRDFLRAGGAAALGTLVFGKNALADNPPAAQRVQPFTTDRVKELLMEHGRVTTTTVAKAMEEGDFCVDDRETKPIIGTPGGDLGLANIAIDAGEKVSGGKITAAGAKNIVEAIPDFNFHTDEGALGRILQHLKEQDGITIPSSKQLLEMLAKGSGNANVDRAIHAAFMDPKNQGCGYQTEAMKDPQKFGMRPDVPQSVLAAALERSKKDGAHVHLQVEKGAHAPGAVLEIDTGKITSLSDMIAIVRPSAESGKVFVLGPEMARFRIKKLLMPQVMKEFQGISEAELQQACFERIDQHANITAAALAQGLPYDVVHIDPNQLSRMEVEHKFVVGAKS